MCVRKKEKRGREVKEKERGRKREERERRKDKKGRSGGEGFTNFVKSDQNKPE